DKVSEHGTKELMELTRILNNETDKIETLLNVDVTLWMLAFNNVIVNLSSYTGQHSVNYYLYQDDDGRFYPIVWDLNLAFGSFKNTGVGSDLKTRDLMQLDPMLHASDPTKPLISVLLADETFNRVMRRLPQMIHTYEGEPARYIVVVARNLHLEYIKEMEKLESLPEHDHTSLSIQQPDDSKEQDFACLEHCLRQLSAQQRKLVVEYYHESKRAKIDHRRQMADEMGINMNALRIRAHRIRAGLEECLKKCLG
ncbi:MAG TPA: CotH kinase family protein, partial [Blastocatellia bacterium]|nr:CotH kinase family protein [Blastocatellia bacterium]